MNHLDKLNNIPRVHYNRDAQTRLSIPRKAMRHLGYGFLSVPFWKFLSSLMIELVGKPFGFSLRTRAKLFWGNEMIVVLPEVVSMEIYRNGLIEEGLTRMLLTYLKPGMTFVDIGAHFGYYTLLASAIVGNEGHVHAFEPTPSTFGLLSLNIRNRNNVRANRFAAYSRRGTVMFNDFGLEAAAFNSIHGPRFKRSILRRPSVQTYKVKTITLDEYVQDTNISPDFVKIDAESAEYEILKGMDYTLEEHRPIITIEVGDAGVSGVPKSKDVVVHLVEKGYRPYEWQCGRFLKHSFKEDYAYDNLLFLPQ